MHLQQTLMAKVPLGILAILSKFHFEKSSHILYTIQTGDLPQAKTCDDVFVVSSPD